MIKLVVKLSIGVLALALAACSSAATPVPPTPTQEETRIPATAAPTPTQLGRPTLPPTWTPVGSEATLEASDTLPTLTPDPALDAVRRNPMTAENCRGFGPDTSRNPLTLALGSPVRIYWTPARNAHTYEVALYDSQSRLVNVQRTPDTSATLRAALFSGYEQLYGWLVTPYDVNNKPICLPRGSELRTLPQ